jgi:hypothetical protein
MAGSTSHFSTDLLGAIQCIRTVELRCNVILPLSLTLGDDLIARIRGAWGQCVLRETERGSEEAEIMRDAFFGSGAGNGTRPWLVSILGDGMERIVVLKLFGTAVRWQNLAFDTFVSSLAGSPGIAVEMTKTALRQPLRISAIEWTRRETFQTSPVGNMISIQTKTPLCLTARGSLDATGRSILTNTMRRLVGLAPWLSISIDINQDQIQSQEEKLIVYASDVAVRHWTRNSSRLQQKSEHVGITGRYLYTNLDEMAFHLIFLGAHIGTGTGTALGMGQYEILACE